MSAAAIDHIWKAIQESERSNRLQFMDNEMLITTAAAGSARPRSEQADAVGCEPIAEVAISLKPVDNDSLQAITSPPVSQP